MGSKKLNNLLKKKIKNIKNVNNFDEFIGKKVGIDLSLFICKFLYNKDNILEELIKQNLLFNNYNITPYYVFDGMYPDEKIDTINNRKNKKSKVNKKIKRLEEIKNEFNKDFKYLIDKNINKLKKRLIYINDDIINTIKLFFNYSNIIYFQFNYESDVVLSSLSKYNIIDYVISDDIDLIVYGSKYMLKNFSFKHKSCVIYSKDDILSKLDIDYDQLIILNLLLGCDYNEKIKNISINDIFNIVYNHKNLNNIQKYLNNDKYNDFFLLVNNSLKIYQINIDKDIFDHILNNRLNTLNYNKLNKLLDEQINNNYDSNFYKNKYLNIVKLYI